MEDSAFLELRGSGRRLDASGGGGGGAEKMQHIFLVTIIVNCLGMNALVCPIWAEGVDWGTGRPLINPEPPPDILPLLCWSTGLVQEDRM